MRQLPQFLKPLLATTALVVILALVAALTTAPPESGPRDNGGPGGSRKNQGLGDGFFWGVASSGFQSEGNPPDSNWTQVQGSRLTPDLVGGAVDFRHRYKQDIALAKDLGANVYRIGIEWSRLEPKPGQADAAEWAYYDDVVKTIKAAGMRPMLTIDHWVYPGWVVHQGGWSNPQTLDDWTQNANRVVDHFAWADPLWVTINEPDSYLGIEMLMYGIASDQSSAIADRLVQAHNNAYAHIHKVQPDAMATSNIGYVSGSEDPVDAMFLDKMRLDYVGVDYYYPTGLPPGKTITDLANDPNMLASARTPWLNPIQPEGVYYALRHFAKRYPGKPLYIVENGLPTDDGRPRADGVTRAQQIRDTVYWVQRAKRDGMPVIGYNYWSLTDNYEWGSYQPRFGLYTVDVKTDPALVRKPTDGGAAYKAVIARNGLPDDYQPGIKPVACSQVDPPSSCDDPVR